LVSTAKSRSTPSSCEDEVRIFKGQSEIDSAEIAGRYEGNLTVRDRLYVRATGKVVGTVRYGRLEIECGGELVGDVQVLTRPVAAPAPEHKGAQACFRACLADARMTASQIGYINAHGTSTELNDKNETIAVKAVFGDHARKLAMSSTKSMTGHTLGAAGGIEAGITALAIARGVLPPTTNYETPDPECDLDYVPNHARELRVDHAMSNSFGFGGTNAALVMSRYKGD